MRNQICFAAPNPPTQCCGNHLFLLNFENRMHEIKIEFLLNIFNVTLFKVILTCRLLSVLKTVPKKMDFSSLSFLNLIFKIATVKDNPCCPE